jgi:hypothetical protein
MAIRPDITVDFSSSPRIITIAAPSTTIILQDLYDTLRSLEDDEIGILYPRLLDAAGKQSLGNDVYVGITLTLRNALLAFAARTGPAWSVCRVTGGNLVATDVLGVTLDTPISPTAYTQIILAAASSSTLILSEGGSGENAWDSTLAGHQEPGTFGAAFVTVGSLVMEISSSTAPLNDNISAVNDAVTEVSSSLTTLDDNVNIMHGVITDVQTVVSGVHDVVNENKEFLIGRWLIANNQMIFFDQNNVEIVRYDLFDQNGHPSMENVFERRKVI